MAFKKETAIPIEGIGAGCLCCSGTVQILPLDTNLYFGFGGYSVTKDGQLWYEADPTSDEMMNGKLLSEIEQDAKADPDCDWRVNLNLPLRDGEWQRHGDDTWVLIKVGQGFA